MSDDTMTKDEIDLLGDLDFDNTEGAAVAKERASEVSGPSFYRHLYLSHILKDDGDRCYMRYLTEFRTNPENPSLLAWTTVDHHASIPTKPKPDFLPSERSWPKAMGCTCRKSKVFTKRYGGQCYVCDEVTENLYGRRPRPMPRTWALGVLRERVMGDGSPELGGPSKKGRPVGFRDALVEVHKTDEDGEIIKDETEWVPQYVFIHQAYDNFFQALAAFGEEYGTVMDRDYLITREGEGKDVSFMHIPQEPAKIALDEDTEVVMDLTDNDIREALYPGAPNPRLEMARQASDDYFAHWFLEGELSQAQRKALEKADEDAKKDGKGGKRTAAPASAKASKEASSQSLASLRDRLKTRSATG